MAGAELIAAAGIGIGLGVVTGVPLGVVNVAIVEAANRRGWRAAAGIGVGGALADGSHAAVAFGGVGRAIAVRPTLATTLYVVSGVLLIAYAVWLLRAPRAASPTAVARSDGGFGRGLATGIGLTLPNPAALGAWIAVAAAVAPGAGLVEAAITGLGVAVGSGAWFVALARLAARGAVTAIAPRRGITRAVAIVIGGVGVAALARAALV